MKKGLIGTIVGGIIAAIGGIIGLWLTRGKNYEELEPNDDSEVVVDGDDVNEEQAD